MSGEGAPPPAPRTGSDDRRYGADEVRLRDGADDLLLHLAALEEDQVRDAADAIARRGLRVLVDVHLEDLQLPVVFPRQLLDHRRDRPARSAPRGPEVDQDRKRALQDLALERVVG